MVKLRQCVRMRTLNHLFTFAYTSTSTANAIFLYILRRIFIGMLNRNKFIQNYWANRLMCKNDVWVITSVRTTMVAFPVSEMKKKMRKYSISQRYRFCFRNVVNVVVIFFPRRLTQTNIFWWSLSHNGRILITLIFDACTLCRMYLI